MKKLFALSILALVIKFSGAQKLVTTYFDWNKIHPNEQYYVNSAGQKNGSYKQYNQHGVIIKEYNYLNGLENGSCMEYGDIGNNQRVVRVKSTFKNGKAEGYFVEYCEYDDYKSKTKEGRFANGKETGLWKEWWCAEIFDDKYWGVLKSVGKYKEGKYDSTWTFYDKKGRIEKSVTYKDGVQEKRWISYTYNDGVLISKCGRVDDISGYNLSGNGGITKDGDFTEYYDNGFPSSSGTYSYNKSYNHWNFYDSKDSGKVVNSGDFYYNFNVGNWKFYYNKNYQATYFPEGAQYYRQIVFDSVGRATKDTVRDFTIAGEKIWEGSLYGKDPYSFKHE